MLRSAPPGHPLQKPTVVQWDIGGMLSADGAADESVSPQSGISLYKNDVEQSADAPADALVYPEFIVVREGPDPRFGSRYNHRGVFDTRRHLQQVQRDNRDE